MREVPSFETANAARTRAAAGRTVPKATEALRAAGVTAGQRKALRLRARHPSMSLAELADMAGWTKDRFAGLLRRGLAAAAQCAPADRETP